jgi:hypothetical protein
LTRQPRSRTWISTLYFGCSRLGINSFMSKFSEPRWC